MVAAMMAPADSSPLMVSRAPKAEHGRLQDHAQDARDGSKRHADVVRARLQKEMLGVGIVEADTARPQMPIAFRISALRAFEIRHGVAGDDCAVGVRA